MTTQWGSTIAFIGASRSSTISSTVTSSASAASAASFCAPTMPRSSTLPLRVGLLRVEDGDVRPERGDGGEDLAGVGAGDAADLGVDARQVGADVAAQHPERQARGAGRVGGGHPRVRVLGDRERARPAVLDRVAQAVERAHARVAAPGEGEGPGAAGADHLVVDDVGRHAHEVQVAPALADDLVPGGEGDEVGEALEGQRLPVPDVLRDRLPETRPGPWLTPPRSGTARAGRAAGSRRSRSPCRWSPSPSSRRRPGSRARRRSSPPAAG